MKELEPNQNKKECSKCREAKSFEKFHKDKSKKYGLTSSCKSCKKQYNQKNKERKKEYLKANRERIRERRKQYCQANKKRIKEQMKQWRQKNRERINQYQKQRYQNDIDYRLARSLRSRFRSAFKGNFKSGSAVGDLGCSWQAFRWFFEQQFYPNPKTGEKMTWDNRTNDGWHIDHIIPLSSFDLTNREEVLKACHYSNLQPLWAEENLKKGSRI